MGGRRVENGDMGSRGQLALPPERGNLCQDTGVTRLRLPIRILVVDDHFVVRIGLAAVLNAEADLRVVAEAGNGFEAIELFRKHHPDVTLMDLLMPGLTGVETTAAICREFPDARIIMMTILDGNEDIYRALQAGARGYVLKKMLGPVLVEAIRTVHAGERYLPAIAVKRLAERSAVEPLTVREEEVLELVVKGLSNKELADVLKITEQTAKVHLKNILRKLDVSDRTEAATSALQRGIVHLG